MTMWLIIPTFNIMDRTGDYIYCHTTGEMDSGQVFGYAGMRYEITQWSSDGSFRVDTEFQDHGWSDCDLFREYFTFEEPKNRSYAGSVIKFNFL